MVGGLQVDYPFVYIVTTPTDYNNKQYTNKLNRTSIPNMYTDYIAFINKIKLNTQQDVLDHIYRGSTDPEVFKRYSVNADIDPGTYQYIGKQLIEFYIHPLMDATGYRFPVRDYHKGGRTTKKITFMFICSQDQGKQRKSRSNNERHIHNRLKVENCESKLSLNYSLPDGIIQIKYNHKSHPPYAWKKHSIRDEDHNHNHYVGHNNHSHHHDHDHYQQQEQQRAIQQAAMNLVDVQNLAQYNQLQNLAQYSQQIQYNPPQQPQPQVVAYAVQQQQAQQQAQQAQAQQYQPQPQQYAQQQYQDNQDQHQQQAQQQQQQQSTTENPQLLPHQQALEQILPDAKKELNKISVDNIDKELIGLNK